MKDKEKQRELIVEIMKTDENSGLYDQPTRKQTAVDFALEQLEKLIPSGNQIIIGIILEKAKQMEEGQIAVAYSTGTLEGVTQNFTNGYSYYEKTYKSK